MNKKVYSVEIEGEEYGFFIEKQEKRKWWLIIPDGGGMADMVPRFPEQYDWINPKLTELQDVKDIWGTIWEIKGKNALKQVEAILLKYGKLSNKNSSYYYKPVL